MEKFRMAMTRSLRPPKHSQGAMLVLIAICLPLFVIMAGFAVNIAWMQLVRTELRTATDASAGAGAKGLSLFQDKKMAQSSAIDAAARNSVAGEPLKITAKQIDFGIAQRADEGARFFFVP